MVKAPVERERERVSVKPVTSASTCLPSTYQRRSVETNRRSCRGRRTVDGEKTEVKLVRTKKINKQASREEGKKKKKKSN